MGGALTVFRQRTDGVASVAVWSDKRLRTPALDVDAAMKCSSRCFCRGLWIVHDAELRRGVESSAGSAAWLAVVREQQAMQLLEQHLGR